MKAELRIHTSIAEIESGDWNALVKGSYPFLRHEFLDALERRKCVGEEMGWIPRHLALYENSRLLGALPLYEKWNSWGEFVFDHAWADAYQRAGQVYYPKLVSAIPYTPITGQRFLVAEAQREDLRQQLWSKALQFGKEIEASGVHCLFPDRQDGDWLNGQGLLTRSDCQFHWHNRGYKSFDDFLATLSAKKRKNIRRERKRAQKAGIEIKVYDGTTASDRNWVEFDQLYRGIYERKWGYPALNSRFFSEVARNLPQQTLLLLAEREGETIAGALLYRDSEALYGRYWGCSEQVDCLHFELCYYYGIDYCIREGLQRFEPGAQGEHKLARGFLPAVTHSCHWIYSAPYREAIGRYVEHERSAVASYYAEASQHSPYRIQPA